MPRPANPVTTVKATYSLPQSQVGFLEARAKSQTEKLKRTLLRSTIYPSHLVSLAIRFYEQCPDIVENLFDWKGKTPITWPKPEDQVDARPLTGSEISSPPATDAGDSQKPNEEPAQETPPTSNE